MPLTLDEILEHEDRLREEISQRERLLTAYRILRTDYENGRNPESRELWAGKPEFLTPTSNSLLVESTAEQTPAPASLPDKLPPQPYMHPELHELTKGSWFGRDSKIVAWAIQRMTDDYSLRDISALLEREGYPTHSPAISVVLTRLKTRGEIEEVRQGAGRTPAVFRKPESALPSQRTSNEEIACAAATTELAAAS